MMGEAVTAATVEPAEAPPIEPALIEEPLPVAVDEPQPVPSEPTDLSVDDIAILGMSVLPWRYEYRGRECMNPAPFRGTDYKLAIGKVDSVDTPNFIWVDHATHEVHVVIKKHKCSGRDGDYVTEMTASEPLAQLLRPVIFSRILSGKSWLFYQRGQNSGTVADEGNIGSHLRGMLHHLKPDYSSGTRGLRHSYVCWVGENELCKKALAIAASMRHSVGTQQRIYMEPTGLYPEWTDVEDFMDSLTN